MSNNIDYEREAFEAWYERTFGARAFAQNVDHSYADELTEMQWAGWQARAAWQRTQSAGVPDFAGIGRDAGHPRAVVLYLRTEPTDGDLRAIQEALRFAAAPAQPAARPEQGDEVQRLQRARGHE